MDNIKAKIAHKLLESCLAHRYPKPKMSVYQEIIPGPPRRYKLLQEIVYYSYRYDKEVTVPAGYISDGATGAYDITSRGWWVHDLLCDRKTWDDGTYCTRWQGSTVLHDILKEEGHWFRCHSWRIATWLHNPFNR